MEINLLSNYNENALSLVLRMYVLATRALNIGMVQFSSSYAEGESSYNYHPHNRVLIRG